MSEDLDKVAFSDVVSCTKCNMAIFKPYYNCLLKHKFCNDCFKKNKKCSECGCFIGGERYLMYDENDQKYEFPCKNFLYGCKYTGSMSENADHAEECKNGPIICPLSDKDDPCRWSGEIRDILKHFQFFHLRVFKWWNPEETHEPKRCRLVRFAEYCTEPADGKWKSHMFAFTDNEEVFLLKFEACPSGKLKFCIDHVTSEDIRKEMKYKYQIIFGKLNGGKRRGVGNLCGLVSYISFNDAINLCEGEEDLSYEVAVFDKETHFVAGYELDFNEAHF